MIGLKERDSFYDEVDCLEKQNIENIMKKHTQVGTSMELLEQFQIYEMNLSFEDGEISSVNPFYNNKEKTQRQHTDGTSNRKSSRFRIKNTAPPIPPPLPSYLILPPIIPPLPLSYMLQNYRNPATDNESSSSGDNFNGFSDFKTRDGGAGVTPGLRKLRLEKAERNRKLQQECEFQYNNQKESDESGKLIYILIEHASAIKHVSNSNIISRNIQPIFLELTNTSDKFINFQLS